MKVPQKKPAKGTPSKKRLTARWEVVQRDGAFCNHCGSEEESELTIDHVKPLALGGKDAPKNMQILCRPCHNKKDADTPGKVMSVRNNTPYKKAWRKNPFTPTPK